MNLNLKNGAGLLALTVLLSPLLWLRAADTAALIKKGSEVETHIDAKSVRVDLKSRTAIYREKVKVDDPRVSMTCEFLTAKLPDKGNRVDSIIAETNVVILIPDKGATNYATADRAVYTYSIETGVTNELLELSGSPVLTSPQGKTTGTKLIWDIAKEVLTGEDIHMVYRNPGASSTNSVGTNAVSEPKPANP
ncbi:MAG: hypothetical protein RLY20_48 [Verrucomicrobiota bacterium]|jgi:lipopolysaccharide export system protein LptA